jgi:hypothetical protein
LDGAERVPGAAAWLRFNDACLQAEARLQRAERAAQTQRDQLINWLPDWTVPVFDRVQRVATALYEAKLKKARHQCENDCAQAEQDLMAELAVVELRVDNAQNPDRTGG